MHVHFVGKIVYQLKYIFGFNEFYYFIKNSIKRFAKINTTELEMYSYY